MKTCLIVHQFALSSGGLKDFLLNAPRSNIIFANKEGLLSLLGIIHYFNTMSVSLSLFTRLCFDTYPRPFLRNYHTSSLPFILSKATAALTRRTVLSTAKQTRSFSTETDCKSRHRVTVVLCSVVDALGLYEARNRCFKKNGSFGLSCFAYTTSCQKCCAEMSSRQISHMSFGLQLTTHLSSLATFYSIWCSFPLERQRYEIRLILRANGCSSRKMDRQAAHPRCWRLSTKMHLSYSCWFVLRTRYLVYFGS